jgi:hypothetical protein
MCSQSRRERKRTPSERSDEGGSPIIPTRDEERQVATLENVAHRVEDDARRTENTKIAKVQVADHLTNTRHAMMSRMIP